MSYYSYTKLQSTNPDLISSGSTFVKESDSELLCIKNGKSHFLTYKNTMDDEITRLSLSHPDVTFIAECHCDTEYYDRIEYIFEYNNGKCKDLAIKPGYVFVWLSDLIQSQDRDQISAFQDHVLKYLERLDLVKEIDGKFIIDRLDNLNCQVGYQSYITITYENDLLKWTATKKGISWIEVNCEKKEPVIDPLKNYENMKIDNQDSDYYDLPF